MADERAVQQRQEPMTELDLATEHQPKPDQQPIIDRKPTTVALMIIRPRVPIVRHSEAQCVEQSEPHTAVPYISRMEHRNECAAKRQQHQQRRQLMKRLEDVR